MPDRQDTPANAQPEIHLLSGSERDYEALAQVRNATLQSTTLHEDYTPSTGEDMRRIYTRGDFSLAGNAWLIFRDEKPAAAALVYPPALFHDRPPGNFQIYVAPHCWGRGLGSVLVAHLQQEAVARGHRVLETTIAQEDSHSSRFLLGHGFITVGNSIHMTRHLGAPLTTSAPEPPYTIRSLVELGEEPEIYLETGNRLGAYDPNYSLIRPEELTSMVASPRWDPAGILFVLEGNRIVGLIRATGNSAGRGYLHEIRLEPSSRGKGLGMLMLDEALNHLQRRGVDIVELDTGGENIAAQALATRAGFQTTRHWLHFLKPIT
ncbi:MAG: GNAT family N-acetyltransferase [Chloroflexota bacterium]|nr:GNAT family N-acetyltransferase [Chloroflexota bacterium]